MSMMDAIDEDLLGVDDDELELDYDLEKDEEDALLADDDNYEDTYGDENHGTDQHYEEPLQNEEESDVLDIDSNVHLDETEEEFGEQSIKENPNDTQESVQQENDDEEEIEEQKERNRFLNERNSSVSISVQRTNSHEIPDTLDKVSVQPVHHAQPHNNQRNGRFQRGNRGRGRGRHNHNRGSVFGRVGSVPMEGKTVLINPHFRGNVQVSENARLVWDSNFQRYQSPPQMAQVAPFQSHPSPWINPPYAEPNNNFNHPIQPNYQEPPPQIQYNQPPEMMNAGIRPLMQVNNQPPPFVAQQPPPPQQQGNFRGRDARFSNQPAIPPLMMNNPPPNFNQQQNYQGRSNFNFPENQNIPPNQNRPFINQNAPPPVIQMQQNYTPQQQNFDQPPPHFIPQNQFNQNRHVQPVYEQYNDHNQFQPPHNQFPSSVHSNQNFQGQNFQQPVNYEPNFIPNQPAQENFPPKSYNHQYNPNHQNNQHQQHQMNNYNNRTPPKRRSFENTTCSGERDLPKKKKRSMELSNLHEVPTVDMPDTTTEEKEEEDEDMKAYRLLVEEQKRLRERVIREKEERRKLAAAQQAAEAANNSSTPADSLLTSLKTRTVATISQQQQNPIVKPSLIVKQQIVNQKIQTVKQPNQQWRPQQQQQMIQQQQQQGQNPVNRNPQQQQQQQQQRQRQMIQQRKQIQVNQQRPQNIQVQTNPAGQRPNQGRVLQQRRIQQQNQQANIVITQKNESQQQRIVMLRQNPNAAKGNQNRRVVLKGLNTVNSDSEPCSGQSSQESPDNGHLSSFLSNRKVISNTSVAETSGVELTQTPLLETPLVVVSNLAAGTTDVKIRKLCQGLGPIQNIQMIPNARQASIRFKNIVSAHKFFKKYQRKIVDLSMIQVSLEPES